MLPNRDSTTKKLNKNQTTNKQTNKHKTIFQANKYFKITTGLKENKRCYESLGYYTQTGFNALKLTLNRSIGKLTKTPLNS